MALAGDCGVAVRERTIASEPHGIAFASRLLKGAACSIEFGRDLISLPLRRVSLARNFPMRE